MLSVRNEVTDMIGCKRNRAILEIGQVLFFREVAEGIFVLSNHQRNARDISATDDLEIEGGCPKRTQMKEHKKQKRPLGR